MPPNFLAFSICYIKVKVLPPEKLIYKSRSRTKPDILRKNVILFLITVSNLRDNNTDVWARRRSFTVV